MQKRGLRLTEISDPSFVDRRRTDGPGVRQVHLLRAGGIVVAEAWQQIGRGGLKPGERLPIEGVVEIVVETQVLLIVDSMIDLYRELIFMRIIVRNGTEEAVDIC